MSEDEMYWTQNTEIAKKKTKNFHTGMQNILEKSLKELK